VDATRERNGGGVHSVFRLSHLASP
jgi:hypothetical protein